MFSRIWTTKSTESFSDSIKRLKNALDSADAVVIGAGAGLSAAAGFDYGGERFHKYFADFEEKYGIHDMYSGGFYPYDSAEEYFGLLACSMFSMPLPLSATFMYSFLS